MIDRLNKLLEQSRIKKILYVDDLFSIDNCHNRAVAQLKVWVETGEYKKISFLSGEKEVAIDEFDKWWKNSSSLEKRDCVFNTMKISVEEQNILSFLNELKTKGFEIEYLDPSEFSDAYISKLKEQLSEDNQVLLLMDKDLGDFGHDGSILVQKVESEEYFHCGLFSGKFTIEDEIDRWKELGFSASVYPISKKRIIEEPQNRIIEGLRNILWLAHISKMKNHSSKILENGYKSTQNMLKQIDPASFDHAVIKKSQEEGCWEYITINRILMVMLENEMQAVILQDDKFSDIQKDFCVLRASSSFPVDSSFDNTWLKKFREEELYTKGEYINRTFSPVTNGDIFMIDGKEYILLCQPCSLSIRKNGGRARNLNTAYLLEIKTKDEDTNIRYEENIEDPNSKRCVNLSAAKICNLSIIDLVSYSSEGNAKIDMDKELNQIESIELLQPNMLKRYKDIKKEMKRYQSIYTACKTGDAKKAVEHYSKACFLTIPTVEGSTISFNVSRTRRYNELLSQVLCSKLMNYMARIALPNDLS